MPSPPSRDPLATARTLLVGPGPRGRELALVLRALAEPRGVDVHAFDDVADLALAPPSSGVCLIDVDAVPVEDVGYVRRFLAARAEVDVVLLGADPRARAARCLGAQRFTAWPPDVEELLALVASAAGSAAPPLRASTASAGAMSMSAASAGAVSAPPRAPAAAPPAPAGAAATLEKDELDQVRAILEQAATVEEFAPPADWPAGPDESAVPAARGERTSRSATARRAEAPARAGEAAAAASRHEERDDAWPEVLTPSAPAASSGQRAPEAPPWWRAQVADLADAAQRIDLSVRALAEAAPEIDEGDLDEARDRLRALEAEVARLMQFTRTLGYVAAPPPAGAQTFDLGEIVHLFAAGLAQSGPEAPRCQFKTAPAANVRSDRQLLSQALDAVFFLVRCTSRKGDLVRAQVQRVEDPAGAAIELSLDFPSGPLEGIRADEIVEPYSLSDLFPELGPNALAAAAGIVRGQGGSLSLSSKAAGRMTWRLRLPRMET